MEVSYCTPAVRDISGSFMSILQEVLWKSQIQPGENLEQLWIPTFHKAFQLRLTLSEWERQDSSLLKHWIIFTEIIHLLRKNLSQAQDSKGLLHSCWINYARLSSLCMNSLQQLWVQNCSLSTSALPYKKAGIEEELQGLITIPRAQSLSRVCEQHQILHSFRSFSLSTDEFKIGFQDFSVLVGDLCHPKWFHFRKLSTQVAQNPFSCLLYHQASVLSWN